MSEEFKRIVLLSDYGSLELAKEIYSHLKDREKLKDRLKVFDPDDMYLNLFNNGEIEVSFKTNIRYRDVFVLKSPYTITRRWNKEEGMIPGLESNVNQSFMEMFIINEGLSRSSARSIINIMPFMPYQRSDKKDQPRVPITAAAMASLLETSAGNVKENYRVVNFNPHAEQIQGFFSSPYDALYAEVLFAEYFSKNFNDLEGWSVWTPDAGGDKRAKKLGKWLNLPVGIGSKDRPAPGEVSKIMIPQGYDLKDNTAIIVDDMGDTCGSLVRCAENLIEAGANKIYACIAHPILTGDAKQKLWENGIELVTTNTIPIKEKENYPNITVLSTAYMLAEAITCISYGDSISEHLFSYPKYKAWKEKNGIQ